MQSKTTKITNLRDWLISGTCPGTSLVARPHIASSEVPWNEVVPFFESATLDVAFALAQDARKGDPPRQVAEDLPIHASHQALAKGVQTCCKKCGSTMRAGRFVNLRPLCVTPTQAGRSALNIISQGLPEHPMETIWGDGDQDPFQKCWHRAWMHRACRIMSSVTQCLYAPCTYNSVVRLRVFGCTLHG